MDASEPPVSPLLQELHWLRIEQRIEFKFSVLVFQCLNGLDPSYLSRDLGPTTCVGFPVAAARIWKNSLPPSVTSSPSLLSFRRQLKTELFARNFSDSSASDYI